MYYISRNKQGKWIIKKSGNKRASKTFDTLNEAIAYCEKYNFEYEIKGKKKFKIILFISLILLFLVGIIFLLHYFKIIDLGPLFKPEEEKPTVIEGEDFSIHFLELGNKYTGDSTYIKAGDIDILIDAGSRKDSSSTIVNYLNQYCEDGILEYVIATHAHQDHIAAFVGSKNNPGIFDTFEVETIIDYGMANSESSIRKDYEKLRDKEISEGAIHYSADELFGDNKLHSNIFELEDGTTMTILEQKYYFEKSSDENDYSVCTLFTNGGNNYLLTGDLEKDGEESLVELNPNLPKCEVFKAGHHGSKTSSNEKLLEMIKPEIVTVCCCAGSSEYTDNNLNMFPTQAFIDRVAKYTDRIYVTTLCEDYDGGKFSSMNGNIVIRSNKEELEDDGSYKLNISCSNNNIILKETEWFKENRVWPIS